MARTRKGRSAAMSAVAVTTTAGRSLRNPLASFNSAHTTLPSCGRGAGLTDLAPRPPHRDCLYRQTTPAVAEASSAHASSRFAPPVFLLPGGPRLLAAAPGIPGGLRLPGPHHCGG